MEYKEIQDLLKLVNKTNLTEVLIQKDGFKLKICKKDPDNNVVITPQAAALPATALTQATPIIQAAPEPVAEKVATSSVAPAAESQESSNGDLYEFKSPMIGTFYRSASPEADVYVKVGDTVEKGQVLCIVEAMKLFNEIESEIAGKIVKIMVEDSQPVEYDQVLFLIDTNA